MEGVRSAGKFSATMKTTLTLVCTAFLALPIFTRADDVYYNIQIASLVSTNSKALSRDNSQPWLPNTQFWHAILDGPGRAYIHDPHYTPWSGTLWPDSTLCIQAPAGAAVTGRFCITKPDGNGVEQFEFKASPADAKPDAKKDFFIAKQEYYQRLIDARVPGGAWFRHEATEAAAVLGKTNSVTPERFPFPRTRETELEDTYDIISGGRALSENLQLDRVLPPTGTNAELVNLTNVTGVTVRAMDWQPLIKDVTPDPDPLAAFIPADQHAIFFPSFQAMTQMIDEANANGTPVLDLLGPRSEDSGAHDFYQKQLCLGMNELSRLLGPSLIKSVAFTGSDAFLRVGTDVAVLFEAKDPDALKTTLFARQKAAQTAAPGTVKTVTGKIEGVAYAGVLSPDRSVSSYIASVSNVVIVCNSMAQLQNLLRVAKGTTPSLATQDEYTFFRHRYPRTDKDETAFVVLSDATIRRWCGPRWRIADSRRTRAAAALTELQARHLPEIVAGTATNSVLTSEFKLPDAGEWRLTPAGVVSTAYGSLRFMTPIAEIPLTNVTRAEEDAYNHWRDNYQNYWRQFYDPIAIRFSITRDKLGAQMTVMPLTASSEYDSIIRFSSGASIAPGAGDPHSNTLLHVLFALNPESKDIRDSGNFLGNFAPGLKTNPFGWLGHSLAIYLDEDPFWDRLKQATNSDEFFEKNYPDLPAALRVEVAKPLGLVAFLTALHAFADQSAPGLTTWQNLDYNGQAYVKVVAKSENPQDTERQPVVYYAATPDSLILTLNEALLKRALDRQAARATAASGGPKVDPPTPWLGTNFCVSVERPFMDVVEALVRDSYESHLQQLSWSNLPILNEWKRLYPDKDPVTLHEQLWGTKLVCPGGGTYVWNEKWQTMESTVFGHPGEPKKGTTTALAQILSAQLGINFENQGISAKAILTRKPAAN